MKQGEQVTIESWACPGSMEDGHVVMFTEDRRGTLIERKGGTFHWQVTTPPIDAGCGATSCTLLAEGDAATIELAHGSLNGALAAARVQDLMELDPGG